MARRTTTPISTARRRIRAFVDTGGWYAVASRQDRYHLSATRYFRALLDAGGHLLTSDYVLDETLTRLRYDAGHAVTLAFWQKLEEAQQAGHLTVLRVDLSVWDASAALFFQYEDQAFSFTDCTSFALAQTHQVDEVFGFDSHFLMFGFALKPDPLP